MAGRIGVQKTLKLYMGGQFARSESGRTVPTESFYGGVINVAKTSRKDLRNTVEKARGALAGWNGRTAYNRGQILYRLAEMIEGRAQTLPTTPEDAFAATDRAVHFAGWTDKITAVLSTLKPVATTYVNYSHVRALGVVVSFPDPADGLLGMVEALCAATVMGDTVLLVVPIERAELATALAECLATCDMPAGVVNVLTGDQTELLGLASRHDDIDGLYLSSHFGADALKDAEIEAARVMRRFLKVSGATEPATPLQLQKLAEVQTVWMSAYEPKGGAAAY